MTLNFFKADQRLFFVYICMMPILFAACSSRSLVDHPTTRATLWVQNAAEYKAICYQIYQIATLQLDKLLAERSDTVMESDYKKYAIITDVDETVLDNSPFQARMIMKNSEYNTADWNQWVNEASASAIPGAIEFFTYAFSNGIEIFYITNREADTESKTRKNLIDLGFPMKTEADNILTKNELPDWNSSKLKRRTLVEDRYNVLMIIGDDLNDFYKAKDISEEQRDELITENMGKWGKNWFILPNPIYGSWEQSLFGFQSGLNEQEKYDILLNSLKTKN